MATTKEQQDQNGSEFEAAFNEEPTAAPEQSEDELMGITAEEGVTGEDGGAPAAVSIELPEEGEGMTTDTGEGVPAEAGPAEELAETPAVEAAEGASGEAAEEPMNQNDKTWNGRLNKREEELNAREQALADKEGSHSPRDVQASDSGESNIGGDKDGTSSSEGGVSADDAMSRLSEDFGQDFVQMIVAIATAKAQEAAAAAAGATVEAVSKNVDQIIAHLTDRGQKEHFKEIHGAHPDFMDVANSPELQQWIAALPEEDQTSINRILATGSAEEIVSLLTKFKQAGAPVDESAIDDAEGVRGGGIQLPTQPAESGDYEKAWEQA